MKKNRHCLYIFFWISLKICDRYDKIFSEEFYWKAFSLEVQVATTQIYSTVSGFPPIDSWCFAL